MTARTVRQVAFGVVALSMAAASCEFNSSGIGREERCGNGLAESAEACDGADLRGETCESRGYDGGTLACSPLDCTFDTSKCTLLSCGNGVIDPPNEQCDGVDLGGQTCQSQNYDSGTLGCTANCSFDTSLCMMDTCGNGVLDTGEQCDGADLNGLTCDLLEYYGGQLLCTATCHYDLTDCQAAGRCGDSSVNIGYEECDGPDLQGQDCTHHGFYRGQLGCSLSCQFDTSNCSGECGDGTRDVPQEECDGGDLGGATCQSLSYDLGDLACDGSCNYDTSGCSMHSCNDGVVGPGEDCDGNDLDNETCLTLGYYGGNLACSGTCHFDVTDCENFGWCGDGTRNGPEVCDDPDMDGESCQTQGYASGTLGCLPDCTDFDFTNCQEAAFGDPCALDSECDSNLCLEELTSGFPGGLCTETCGTCTAGVCAFIPWLGASYCLPDCGGCRTGYSCFNFYGMFPSEACFPHCEDDGECDSNDCNGYTGTCNLPVSGSRNGDACGQDSDCRGYHCEPPPGWVGGYCMSPCDMTTTGDCPGDGVCMDHSGGNWGDMGLCYDGCVNGGDCRSTNYNCEPDGPNGENVCVPK